MVANTALFNLFLFNHFCNVFKFELQCKFLQKFDILQKLKVLSYKEKVLLHRSIFGGGTNIKFLVIQLSAIWHYLLCVQKIWLTLRYSVYHWMARGITVTEKNHKTSVGSDNDVAMVIKVCVFLSQKGQWSVWYSNYFTSKFYL